MQQRVIEKSIGATTQLLPGDRVLHLLLALLVKDAGSAGGEEAKLKKEKEWARFLKVCRYDQLRRNSCYNELGCNSHWTQFYNRVSCNITTKLVVTIYLNHII